MELELENFIDDFVDTIMFDIENTNSQKTFIRYDIKETIKSKLHEFEDNIIAEYKEENKIDQESLNTAYDNGYEDGWNDAREEIQELARDMRRY